VEHPSPHLKAAFLTVAMLAQATALALETGANPDSGDGGQEQLQPEAGAPKKPGYHTEYFRVRPSLSITEKYDDNIYATNIHSVSDWITLVSPQLKIDSTWAEHSLRFEAGADFGRYWDQDTENFLDYWASAEGRFTLSETIDLYGGLGMSFDHETRDSLDANIGGLTPTTYRSLTAHAGAKTAVGDTTYRIGGTYESLDFDNVESTFGPLINKDRDRDLFGFGVRATHRLNAHKQFFLQALYDRRDYDHTPDLNGYDRNSHGYRAALGLKHDFGSGNEAEAYLGVIGQRYDDRRFDAVNEADFGGRLNLAPSKTTRITAELQRSLNETTLAATPGYINTVVSGRIEYGISPRLIPYLSLGYDTADYLQSGLEDKTYTAAAGVKYFVARNAYVSAGVGRDWRDSNDKAQLFGSGDFDKNSVFLTFGTQGYPLSEPMVSEFTTLAEVEAGALFVSSDSMRFGRYSGLTDEGLQFNGNLFMHGNDGKRGYAEITGLDLGLESRSIKLDWGSQGNYDAFIDYAQIPFRDFVGQNIFDGIHSNHLALPGGWVDADSTAGMTQLTNSLSGVDIGTTRKRLGIGTLLHSVNNWTLTLGYETETKDGLEQEAGALGTSSGNTRSSILPAPVDYTTNTLSASLGYLSEHNQLEFSYQGSFFYNGLEELTWENPFDGTSRRGPLGSTALAPDNQFHQLTLSGGRTLHGTTRLTGIASVGAMLQDQDFLPDTVNPGLTPHDLPRNSLDGEVYLYNAMLTLSSRPLRGLNLKASYRMQKRDNDTPVDSYTYYVNDSSGGLSGSAATDTNTAYSYDKRTLRLDAGYRINRTARLSGDLSRETFERSPSEVRKTTENLGRIKLHLKPLDNVQLSLGGGKASRTGSDYRPVPGENPLLRKYNISDRDRISSGVDFAYQPTDRLALSANLEYNDDDYDATLIGLTDARQTGLTLDASYQVSRDIFGHAYIGRELYWSNQSGSQSPNDPDWHIKNKDTVDSLGLGLRWKKDSRLEIGADYVFSHSTGESDVLSDNLRPPVSQYPDLKSRLHSLGLFADYQWRRDTKLKFSYRYERYDEDDWSLDGVGPAGIPEVLTLGRDYPAYGQHVVGISVLTRF